MLPLYKLLTFSWTSVQPFHFPNEILPIWMWNSQSRVCISLQAKQSHFQYAFHSMQQHKCKVDLNFFFFCLVNVAKKWKFNSPKWWIYFKIANNKLFGDFLVTKFRNYIYIYIYTDSISCSSKLSTSIERCFSFFFLSFFIRFNS